MIICALIRYWTLVWCKTLRKIRYETRLLARPTQMSNWRMQRNSSGYPLPHMSIAYMRKGMAADMRVNDIAPNRVTPELLKRLIGTAHNRAKKINNKAGNTILNSYLNELAAPGSGPPMRKKRPINAKGRLVQNMQIPLRILAKLISFLSLRVRFGMAWCAFTACYRMWRNCQNIRKNGPTQIQSLAQICDQWRLPMPHFFMFQGGKILKSIAMRGFRLGAGVI